MAYEGMERFFPADKIIMTGNPVRQNVLSTTLTKEEARKQFGLNPEKKTILLVGGSLGARNHQRKCLAEPGHHRKKVAYSLSGKQVSTTTRASSISSKAKTFLC